jgi:hypothetical protein
MRYLLLSTLVLTACGSTQGVDKGDTSTVTVNSTIACPWISPEYDFSTSSPAKTPPAVGSGEHWQVQGMIDSTNATFSATLDIDANNAPWIALQTSEGLEQEVCPASVDVSTTRFTFKLQGDGWLGVTATTGTDVQTWYVN